MTDDDLANLYSGLGVALVRAGSRTEGLWYLDRAVTLHEKLVKADPPNAWAKRDLALAYARRAEAASDVIATSREGTRCADLARSASVWQQMRDAGILSVKDFADASEIWSQSARCTATNPSKSRFDTAGARRATMAAEDSGAL